MLAGVSEGCSRGRGLCTQHWAVFRGDHHSCSPCSRAGGVQECPNPRATGSLITHPKRGKNSGAPGAWALGLWGHRTSLKPPHWLCAAQHGVQRICPRSRGLRGGLHPRPHLRGGTVMPQPPACSPLPRPDPALLLPARIHPRTPPSPPSRSITVPAGRGERASIRAGYSGDSSCVPEPPGERGFALRPLSCVTRGDAGPTVPSRPPGALALDVHCGRCCPAVTGDMKPQLMLHRSHSHPLSGLQELCAGAEPCHTHTTLTSTPHGHPRHRVALIPSSIP